MTTWFTSDNHWGHLNVIRYCNRPFSSIEEMNEEMVTRWNSVVKPGDVVYHLGDFSLSPQWAFRHIRQLNGDVYLIPGNHDACHPKHKKAAKEKLRYIYAGFKDVLPHIHQIKIGKHNITLCHMPYTTIDERFLEWKPENKGSILLCGHVHISWHTRDKMINVGVDQYNFYPVSEDQILETIDSL